jgi:hypothetical protein
MTEEQLDRAISNMNFSISMLRTCASRDKDLTNEKDPAFNRAISILENRRNRLIQMRKNL